MRPGGTQTKHGAAVRMRRRLGLAPRACVLLSCSLVWAVVVVSAALLASGARMTVAVGHISWSGTLPGIVAVLALALPSVAGIAVGALARNRRAGFLQGVLALSACEVPALAALACAVFSQHAVAGGLVAAIIATYALTWFLLAMGFAFELPVVSARRAKIPMATPLAGGAAAVRAFGGPAEVSDTISATKEG